MTLLLYFRLIMITLFQPLTKLKYDDFRTIFYCPKIVCKDGFSISLQIHKGNYCSTENGYRQYGISLKTVEWGFPNQDEKLLHKSAEDDSDVTQTVGSIDLELMQKICDNHGGIDWEATLAEENVEYLIQE